ncbi:MAG: hypothetical protein WC071_07205 [Victivallaceae bacterium]
MSRKLSGKILLTTGITLITVVVLLFIAAAGWYWYGVKRNLPVEQLGAITLVPDKGVELGQSVTASVLLKCPWHRHPVEAVATIGKGASLVDEPVFRKVKIYPGYYVWQVSAEFKPYRTGMIPAGKLEVKLNRYNDQTSDLGLEFTIPEFKVSPLAIGNDNKLLIASKIDEPIHNSKLKYYIFFAVAAVIIGCLFLMAFLRKRRSDGSVVITPWGLALLELNDLRSGMSSGKLGLDICFGKLTDIVREYLEKRFKLHAPKQTTYEFLEDISQSGGALPETHRPFLKDFMTAADLVKFAKLPPDEQLLSHALDKAEQLVSETRQDIEPAEGDKK